MYYKCIWYENDFWLLCTDFSHVESLSLIYRDIIHKLWDFWYLLYKAVIKKNYILSKNENLLKLAHTKLMIPQGRFKKNLLNELQLCLSVSIHIALFVIAVNGYLFLTYLHVLPCFLISWQLLTVNEKSRHWI